MMEHKRVCLDVPTIISRAQQHISSSVRLVCTQCSSAVVSIVVVGNDEGHWSLSGWATDAKALLFLAHWEITVAGESFWSSLPCAPCACSLLCQSQLLTRTNPTKQDFLTLCNNRKASFYKGGGQLKGSYAEDREVRRTKQQPMKMYPVYTIHTRYILASYFASFLPHSPSKMIDKSLKLLGHWRIWISSRNSPNHSI